MNRRKAAGIIFEYRVTELMNRCLLAGLLLIFFLRPPDLCHALAEGEGYLTAADGVRLFYRIVGSGPETLVVVHGGPGNSMASLLPDLEPLAQGRTVIYYDQRGNGRSDLLQEAGQLTIAKHVQDLEAVRRHFHLETMNLLGNSWGGLLVGFYAFAHPARVERMILHSPASPSSRLLSDATASIYQRLPEDRRQQFIALSTPERWVNARDPRKLCQEFYEILTPVYFSDPATMKVMKGDACAVPIEALRIQLLVSRLVWSSLGDWDLQPALREVQVPTLVIHGRHDMIPVESSRAWASALPDARLLLIDSGHMAHIEQPALFFRAVETFLAGEWPEQALVVRAAAGDE
jgi:proline iminopeptidase